MSKELEALKIVKYNSSKEVVEAFDVIEKGLQRLASIDNANPSEALEDLDKMANQVFQVDDKFELYYNKVKQHLLKAQEQEKVLEIIKEKPIESGIAINYYIKQQLKNNIVVDYKQYKKTIYDLSQIYLLTQEEFDLLKRWLG